MSVPAATRPVAHRTRPPGRRLPRLPAEQVPDALRSGAAFAAFFGTLWFVQGELAAARPAVAGAGVAVASCIVAGVWASRARRPRAPAPIEPEARRARRWITRATIAQLAVSVPGAVAVQLVEPTVVIPFVVITVGMYLLALAPVIGRVHLWVAGGLLVAIPVAVLLTLDGTDRVLVTGLAAGTAFLAKGVVDVVLAIGHRRR